MVEIPKEKIYHTNKIEVDVLMNLIQKFINKRKFLKERGTKVINNKSGVWIVSPSVAGFEVKNKLKINKKLKEALVHRHNSELIHKSVARWKGKF